MTKLANCDPGLDRALAWRHSEAHTTQGDDAICL